jgi:hypothetical protein
MFGFVGRRWLAIAGVSAVGLAGGVAVAVASGGGAARLPAVPRGLSLEQQAAAVQAKLAAHAGPKASATVAGHAATIACGQTITATTTLTGTSTAPARTGS